MQNQNILSIVETFAKQNKISKAKLMILAEDIQRISKPEHIGRPMLDKTKEYYKRVKNAIYFGYDDSVSIRNIIGESDKIRLNNALSHLEKTGQIKRMGKKQTGKQGRQPFVFTLVK